MHCLISEEMHVAPCFFYGVRRSRCGSKFLCAVEAVVEVEIDALSRTLRFHYFGV